MIIGSSEDKTSLFEVVVRISRDSKCGIRFEICCFKFMIEVELSTGKDKVDGKPRPGNEVKRTLITRGAILRTFRKVTQRYFAPKRGQIERFENKKLNQ